MPALSSQQLIERCLWQLHKSPRDHIDHLLGTPRDHSVIFKQMMEEGSLIQNFRFRGFPDRSMESPRHPVTRPLMKDRVEGENHTPVYVRNYRQPPDGQSGGQMLYGDRPVDNTYRQRGLRNPPLDPPSMTEGGKRGYPGWREQEPDKQRMKREIMQDLQRERERKQGNSPQRDNRQENRWNTEDRYQPESSRYQPSFGSPASRGEPVSRGVPVSRGANQGQNGLDLQFNQGQNGLDLQSSGGGARSPRRNSRGMPATDFLKHDQFEGRTYGGQDGRHGHSNRADPGSPTAEFRGKPVTDFPQRDDYGGQTYQRQNGLDLQSRGEHSRRRDGEGLPVTDFLKHDQFEGARSPGRSPGRGYRLPEEPHYNPFGRAGGGAPMVDSQGNRNPKVFGNFKNRDPGEMEKENLAKNRMREDLFRGIEEQRSKRSQDVQYQRKPETDLAELMRRKEVGRPKVDPNTGTPASHHLPSSDVSKVKMNYTPRDGKATEEYRKFLQEQMEERQRDRQEERERQRIEADQHFMKADSQWGQLGGGAPKHGKEHRKLNLDHYLHGRAHGQAFYQKNAPYATGSSYGC